MLWLRGQERTRPFSPTSARRSIEPGTKPSPSWARQPQSPRHLDHRDIGPMNIVLVDGDLLNQSVDAIVNAWNRNLLPWWLLLPQGVSGAIKRRAGTAPFRELRRHG